jgi:hypothetical protein
MLLLILCQHYFVYKYKGYIGNIEKYSWIGIDKYFTNCYNVVR